MRKLNDIISRRFLEILAESDAAARRENGEGVDLVVVSKRMAERLAISEKSVETQLKRILGLKPPPKRKPGVKPRKEKFENLWKADYIEAAASAFGKDPTVLCSLDRANPPDEMTRSQQLWNGVGSRFGTLPDSRNVARLFSRLMDTRARFDLVCTIGAAVLAAKSKGDAYRAIDRILEETQAFDTPARNLRSRKPRRRQSVSATT